MIIVESIVAPNDDPFAQWRIPMKFVNEALR